MLTRLTTLIPVIAILIAAACARQVAPTGGPKDTIPPILLRSVPANNQINVKSNTIELTFSEMIALNNPKEQILITPQPPEYETTTRKNKVILKVKEPFKDSVTYSINFREAIKDVTEKNAAQNLQIAFSTTSYIDSLSIKGSVYDILKGIPPKASTVGIYQFNDTLSIFKHKPVYITKTDKDGNFIINNLKPGKYSIFAIEDRNKNLVADTKSESYGFIAKPFYLNEDTSNLKIPITKLDSRPLKLTSARPYNNYFNIKTSKSITTYKLKQIANTDSVISNYGEDFSNIRIFNTFEQDSTAIHISAKDSLENQLDTTLYVKFNKREQTPEKLTLTADNLSLLEHKGQLDITLRFNKPTFIADQDSILFKIDSAHTVRFDPENYRWDTNQNMLYISKKLDRTQFQPTENKTPKSPPKTTPAKQGTRKQLITNQFKIGRGALVSIDKDTVPPLNKEIKPLHADELGIIFIQVKTKENIIAQLLDKNYLVIRQTRNTEKIKWEDLSPSDYRVRIIIDKNNNGKWDPGNYLLKIEPEPIIFYTNPKTNPPNTIHVKANWEVGEGEILITY